MFLRRVLLTLVVLLVNAFVANNRVSAQEVDGLSDPSLGIQALLGVQDSSIDPLIVTLWVDETNCVDECVIEALALPATSIGSEHFCIENPIIQSFDNGLGRRIRGVLLDGTLYPSSRELTVLLEISDSENDGVSPTYVCAPRFFTMNRRTSYVIPRRTFSIGGPLVAPAGLTRLLLGYRSRSLVQIELQSTPPGADILLDGAATPYRTNQLIAVPQRMLTHLSVRLNRIVRPLRACTYLGGQGRVEAIFRCEMDD